MILFLPFRCLGTSHDSSLDTRGGILACTVVPVVYLCFSSCYLNSTFIYAIMI